MSAYQVIFSLMFCISPQQVLLAMNFNYKRGGKPRFKAGKLMCFPKSLPPQKSQHKAAISSLLSSLFQRPFQLTGVTYTCPPLVHEVTFIKVCFTVTENLHKLNCIVCTHISIYLNRDKQGIPRTGRAAPRAASPRSSPASPRKPCPFQLFSWE